MKPGDNGLLGVSGTPVDPPYYTIGILKVQCWVHALFIGQKEDVQQGFPIHGFFDDCHVCDFSFPILDYLEEVGDILDSRFFHLGWIVYKTWM